MAKTEEQDFPRYLRMDREIDKDFIEPLIANNKSPFFGFQKTAVYIMAASLGYKNQTKKKTKRSKDVRLFKDLDSKQKWALLSIAIAEKKTTDVLLDGHKAIDIVEQYANGGAKLLYNKVFNEKLDFLLENEMIKVLEKSKI